MASPRSEAIEAAIGAGVPCAALEVYGRWWQLERYLRELVYAELRAAYVSAWVERLGGGAPLRAERDRVNAYMASADAEGLLAYTDVTALFKLVEAEWELFEPTFLPQARWRGLCEASAL
jgi:hypothetical protein